MEDNIEELDDGVYQEIEKNCHMGDEEVEKGNLSEAVGHYKKAWELLPEPQAKWNASTWILAAIGDVRYQMGEYEKTITALEYAIHCPDGLGNPFIHLRLGQSYFEKGQLDKAADELARAYMGAGEDIFSEQEAKYFDFLKTKIEV